ncbi:MAG: hypothetical protein JXR46_14555 [Calditrichaceae bacterium]|nr:hypothetical protein [Calditrichaceae bacterium]MBN2710261.1 hypothetical protein [Calditrichaceae bacterium]RQV93883.1 MAG: hypothetical protein EH224_11695 [Calditrichota bacterium]
MAGNLLLISKKPNNPEFNDKKNKLIKFIDQTLRPYFNGVNYYSESDDYFLTEFKKDNRPKMYRDSKNNWLVFEGMVFSLNETKTFNAEELWKLYKQDERRFADKLDGHFVIKLYDAEQDKYLIINDFIKAKTNYYVETDEYILFTPFLITSGIIINTEPDLEALNEYFWRYYVLSEKTLFRDVKRLSPASIYEIKNSKISKRTYWEFPKELTKSSFDESVSNFVDSIKETARLMHSVFGKPSSDLTQGQDSRIIMSAFLKQNLPVTTTIFGEDNFSEVKNVALMAKRHHLDHHTLHIKADFDEHIWEYFKRAVILGSGDEPGYLLGRILHMRDQQAEYGNVLLNGAGGPFYKDCFWEEVYALNFYREPGKIDPGKFLKLRIMNKNYEDSFFSNAFLKVKLNSANYFLAMLEDSIAGYKHLPISMQIDKFALYKWQNYALTGNNVSNIAYNSFSPLLLRRNLEIGVNMPAQWRWNKSKFQRTVMYAIDPALAREKTDFGGINMVPKNAITFIPFYFRYVFKQSERMRNKMLNRLGYKVKTHLQAAWDYIPVYKRLFEHEEMQKLLHYPVMHMAAFLDADKWKDYTGRFAQKKINNQNDFEHLYKIATMEYLLKLAKSINK